MSAYNFPHKRRESYALVARVKAWLELRNNVESVIDLQDDPRFFYRGDLVIVRQGGIKQYMEVKCESNYTRQSTQNLAIERFSSIEKRTSGGAWSTTADFYAHIYNDGLLVVMNRHKLLYWLEGELARDAKTFVFLQVPNEGYTTGTYLVPRQRAKVGLSKFYREYEA